MLHDLSLPVPIETAFGSFELRRAVMSDLEGLVALLADDEISPGRGDRADPVDTAAYQAGLSRVLASAENELLVVTDAASMIVGTFQLTWIPGLARRGATRMQVEAVRVSSALRSGGLGSAMMRWVLETAAPAAGAGLVQLTSDAQRAGAHRFYERLGFLGSHRGFKFQIP